MSNLPGQFLKGRLGLRKGAGTSAVGEGERRRFCLSEAGTHAEGMGVCAHFSGGFFCALFSTSHLSGAKMCPWVVPKANRLWAGHSRQPDGAFALMARGRWLPAAWTPLWAHGR